MGYTKLFGSIIHSTIWREPAHVRLVWITMLAIADRDGEVMASVPGLADSARVDLESTISAIKVLSEPDEHSSDPANEGRRISKIQGGWMLLNHGKYRAKMVKDEKREADKLRKRDERDAVRNLSKFVQDVQSVTKSRTPDQNKPNHTRANKTRSVHTRGSSRLPQDWIPKKKHHELAAERGLSASDVRNQLAMFRDHEFNRAYRDWDRVFNNWLRKANPSRPGPGVAKCQPTTKWVKGER